MQQYACRPRWINTGVKMDWCSMTANTLRQYSMPVKALQLLNVTPVLCFVTASAKQNCYAK